MTSDRKAELKRILVQCLRPAAEIRKIVVFGSFLTSASPNDMDVAVFQDSTDGYLPLALRYRRMVRPVSERLPVDIIPLRRDADGEFMASIDAGETVYER